jgi:23S rRNA pseudouridine955/2504/2580 synthase
MQKLQANDLIRIPPKLVYERQTQEEGHVDTQLPPKMGDRLSKRILHEDERLLIIDKPSGMAVHGGSGISLGVIEALRLIRPELPYLELVHRLDRSTSGCLMLAKKRSALREMHTQIRENKVDKQYLALVQGHWKQRARVDLPLDVEHRRNKERHVVVSDEGKQAISHFNLQQNYEILKAPDVKASLMRVDLETGRTHQIRAHALAKGHPLACDKRYGDKIFNEYMAAIGLKRLFLHAHSLGFKHPGNNQFMQVVSQLPDELARVLEKLHPVD